ncbi:MAG: hypothetical protein ABIH47_10710 [Candidatus Omnitrophota bacterium]
MIIVCLLCMHVGCAQLMYLPIFIISIPFQIIKLVFALLPLAIKYAPLALLFVSKEHEDSIDNLHDVINTINKDGTVCTINVCSISPTVLCYKMELVSTPCDKTAVAAEIERILTQYDESRILFAYNLEKTYTPEVLFSLFNYMVQEDIRVGQDKRLELSSLLPDRKKS